MSKIIQVLNGVCHWDATVQFPTLEATKGRFAPNIVFVEAPDYVFEGWGFDALAEGDARFIKPTVPEGWLYDDETGTFYREEDIQQQPTQLDRIEAQIAYTAMMTDTLLEV